MISTLSIPALSTPAIRDVRANERLAPTPGRRTVIPAPTANGTAMPSALSPRGSILNLSV